MEQTPQQTSSSALFSAENLLLLEALERCDKFYHQWLQLLQLQTQHEERERERAFQREQRERGRAFQREQRERGRAFYRKELALQREHELRMQAERIKAMQAGYLDDLRYVVQKAKQAFLSAVRRSDGYQPVLDLKS